MKLLFVLGNGFDIKIGINSRYTDFYNSFIVKNKTNCPINPNGEFDLSQHSELINMMEKKKNPNWSDLELLFGSELYNFKTIDKIINEKAYLEQEINNYLVKEQERINISKVESVELRQCLDDNIRRIIDLCKYHDKKNFYEIEFITFNYTNIIDRLVDSVNSTTHSNFLYKKPYHIHGTTGKTVILGVDNKSQLMHSLNQNEENKLAEIMLKPRLNLMVRKSYVSDIEKSISETDEIIIYGASIGDTDSTWWNIISKWLMNNENNKLNIIGYLGNNTPASATAQAQVDVYKERFIKNTRIIDDTVKTRISTHICEDWMFNFPKYLINVKSKGMFENLIKKGY